MNFLKKIFKGIKKQRKTTDQENQSWYNNAHEQGEAAVNSIDSNAVGSNGSYYEKVAINIYVHNSRS